MENKMTDKKFEAYQNILDKYREEHRLRIIPQDRDIPDRIDLSGNDYLGLAANKDKYAAEFLKDNDAALSASASRLLASRQESFFELESLISGLYGKAALIFNSGYHANVGTISALAIPGTIFLLDKLIHASVIDGISMAHPQYDRWKHNDYDHLRRLLVKYHDSADRIIIVAESIYSMDGDMADLLQLVELKREFPKVILYLDEAHGFGVRGNKGLGLAEELHLINDFDIIIGTLGKACASCGAFVATSELLHDFLLNNARSFIFSTAIPPLNIRWTHKMICEIVKMKDHRDYLKEISKDFRNFISKITGTTNPSSSQIIPLMVGDAQKALEIADKLNLAGIDALAIRRPTVPPGGERIRFSLNAAITKEQLNYVMGVIENIYEA